MSLTGCSPAPFCLATVHLYYMRLAESNFFDHYLHERYLPFAKREQVTRSSSQEVPPHSSNYEELNDAVNRFSDEVLDEVAEEALPDPDYGTWNELKTVEFETKTTDLEYLFRIAKTNHCKAILDNKSDVEIFSRCYTLFKKDYECKLLENPGGTLSWNYPLRIIIPIHHKVEIYKKKRAPLILPTDAEFDEYCELAAQACAARCRNRFPVPAILCNGKYICRSGTLAVQKGYAFAELTKPYSAESPRKTSQPVNTPFDNIKKLIGFTGISRIWKTFKALVFTNMDDVKDRDVAVLNRLNIEYISDLMKENRKLHTGIIVSSSEKVNLLKYGKFKTLTMPYPGCEFFKQYTTSSGRSAAGLVYNWENPLVTSFLGLIDEEGILPNISGVDWDQYQLWDLVELTSNYMKLLLYFIKRDSGSILVHCISGWDRTPLFISLLRISLWADELVHQSLTAHEMAYLTLGYDWYLFGHNLPSRIRKGEELMHFCFVYVKHLAAAEFIIKDFKSDYAKTEHIQARANKLEYLSTLLKGVYEDSVPVPTPRT